MKKGKLGRSALSAIAIASVALLAVPVLKGSGERNGLMSRLSRLKRIGTGLLVGRAVVQRVKRVQFWLPIVVEVIALRSQLKHAMSRGAQSSD